MNVLLKCKTFCKNYDFNGTNISVFRAISIVLSVFLDVILHVIPINIPFFVGSCRDGLPVCIRKSLGHNSQELTVCRYKEFRPGGRSRVGR